MRVLILTQHFTPEITAARSRLHPMAELLAQRGHEVEVLTAVPNHPEGVIAEEFRGRISIRRELNGFHVHYVWVKASPRKTKWTRLMLYGSYATMATLAGFASRRPDVVFASSPPLPVAAAGMAVAFRHRIPWVMDVRDLWPEVAVVLGELTNKQMIRAAERLERRLYTSATAITTVTEAFRSDIAAMVDDDSKISLIRNGTTPLWLETGALEVDRTKLGLPADRFVWTYAGNVGIAQGLETAIDAAAQLGDGYRLLVIGSGPMLDRIKQRAEDLPPGRVVFHGLVQPAGAARYLRASDANLVPLAARPALEKVIPSKLFDCCAVGRPVILAAEGESRRLAEAAQAAYPVPPGDSAALANALRTLRDDAGLCERLAERG
ncbi:MAG: glycosyltransferase family 4 protein, partial [Actinomycetota bacterium]|nr:glycosyltransferase family 4 protein [Actinomycetota bacterium]